ncbi:MAG: ribosome maturation factor RimP [Burkholderiales bacterium]|nr:ribosome maturation factor RimP [Burkholderiales bacterium]MDE2076414.1 ribosome maturation factor RimP [Burkholderiales bacterium]
MTWQNVVENTVTGLGYELVDCERSSHGLLRVYIDRLPGQSYDLPGDLVTVDDCEKVTRQLQYALEVVNCDYSRLEVSSPGVDRPLKTPAHFERFLGELVEISLKVPFQGRKKYRGVLDAVPAQSEGEAPGWQLILSPEGDDQTNSKGGNKPLSKTAQKKAAAKKAAEPEVQQALGFTLDEIREARLVPIVSFKGRGSRAATPATGGVTVDEAQELGGQKK